MNYPGNNFPGQIYTNDDLPTQENKPFDFGTTTLGPKTLSVYRECIPMCNGIHGEYSCIASRYVKICHAYS